MGVRKKSGERRKTEEGWSFGVCVCFLGGGKEVCVLV